MPKLTATPWKPRLEPDGCTCCPGHYPQALTYLAGSRLLLTPGARWLRKGYDIALHASCRAAEALDELAVASGAPSRVLAFARAAALVQDNLRCPRFSGQGIQ